MSIEHDVQSSGAAPDDRAGGFGGAELAPGKHSIAGSGAREPAELGPGKRTRTEALGAQPALQLREVGPPAEGVDVHAAADRGLSGAAGQLPYLDVIQRSFGRFNVRDIPAHAGPEAAAASQEIGAQAYATRGRVAFAKSPTLRDAAHEAAHAVLQREGASLQGGMGQRDDRFEIHADRVADKVEAGESAEPLLASMIDGSSEESGAAGSSDAGVQAREVEQESQITGAQDWTRADRERNTQRWKDACLRNLNAVDSSQYVKIVERRDFYRWFYEHTAALGYTTRWALAASLVADGAHQIADMDATWYGQAGNDTFGVAGVELQGMMREGNQVIFDNVLPKLKRLLDGGPLRGRAAMQWDMQILAEEQNLIQPMYARMSPATRAQLNTIARKQGVPGLGAGLTGGDQVTAGPYSNGGTVPGFSGGDLQSVGDRWRYGMDLGNQFTPGGSGFNPATDTMPAVGAGYTNGTELARVDTRQHLHQLDAWLNPNRLTRVRGTPGADLQATISALTPFEKRQVLTDRSPDGWAYSIQFAQFGSITEDMVRQALPTEPASASAVAAFLERYRAERRRVELRYPTPMPFMGMP